MSSKTKQLRYGQALPLTAPREDGLDDKIGRTWPGQAHFAGTGPKGKTCRECRHWGNWNGRARKGGQLVRAVCMRFKELTGKRGAEIPHRAGACSHFVLNQNTPPVVKLSLTEKS